MMKNWIEFNENNEENHIETLDAKIRNKLSPYWNLIQLLKEYNNTKNEKIWEFIMREVENIENGQDTLLELVNKIK